MIDVWPCSFRSALRKMALAKSSGVLGAGYGVVQGAIEAGENPAEAAAEAVAAARDVAHELGIDADEAAAVLAAGALEAAAASDGDSLAAVQKVLLPETELSEIDKSPSDESNEEAPRASE